MKNPNSRRGFVFMHYHFAAVDLFSFRSVAGFVVVVAVCSAAVADVAVEGHVAAAVVAAVVAFAADVVVVLLVYLVDHHLALAAACFVVAFFVEVVALAVHLDVAVADVAALVLYPFCGGCHAPGFSN